MPGDVTGVVASGSLVVYMLGLRDSFVENQESFLRFPEMYFLWGGEFPQVFESQNLQIFHLLSLHLPEIPRKS